ncbi:MAG: ATP-grasp domain-containing protein [Candidatus Pacebacteria bacterium]|nr:ATP-grasp domain-containing protein [Candidatus Paceibacterota bacterium]
MLNIAIVYSKTTHNYAKTSFSITDDTTKDSAIEIFNALKKKKTRPFFVPVDAQHIEKIIRNIQADCIFNLIEWTGKDLPYALFACLLIEQSGIPFTGATTHNFHLISDKVLMKRAFDRAKIPTPRWQTFIRGNEPIRKDFKYPIIIKPSLQHCSIGLSRDMVVDSARALQKQVREQMRRFDEPVFAEEFIEGREFQVAVIEKDGKPVVLPPVEILFKYRGKDSYLTFESRWDEKHPDYQMSDIGLPKNMSKQLRKGIEDVCTKIFAELDYRDYMRADIRVRRDRVFVLEANCNPGLGDDDESAIPIAHHAVGMSFEDYIWGIVQSCLRRFGKTKR